MPYGTKMRNDINVNNLLGREGLHSFRLSQKKNKTHANFCGLFGIITIKFRPQYNKTILSLQYCKLSRQAETAEDWIGRLRIMTVDCKFANIKKQIGI